MHNKLFRWLEIGVSRRTQPMQGLPKNGGAKSWLTVIELLGSMLELGKGDVVTLQTKWTGSIYDSSWFFNPRFAKYRQPGNLKFPFWLTPDKYYVGAAWYQKEITIPASWKAQNIHLFLEHCYTETTLWMDDQKVSMQDSMVAPHNYYLAQLSPGRHTITICIDNHIKDINAGPDSHSLTDHTQGNWNGLFRVPSKYVFEAYTKDSPDELKPQPPVKK